MTQLDNDDIAVNELFTCLKIAEDQFFKKNNNLNVGNYLNAVCKFTTFAITSAAKKDELSTLKIANEFVKRLLEMINHVIEKRREL